MVAQPAGSADRPRRAQERHSRGPCAGRPWARSASAFWARFREFGDDPDDYAHRRPGRTEVVVLEPATAAVAGAREDGVA